MFNGINGKIRGMNNSHSENLENEYFDTSTDCIKNVIVWHGRYIHGLMFHLSGRKSYGPFGNDFDMLRANRFKASCHGKCLRYASDRSGLWIDSLKFHWDL